MKNLYFTGLFMALLLFPVASFASPITSENILESVNKERSKAGLSVLEHDTVLDMAAQAKLEEMKSRGYFGHKNPNSNLDFSKFLPWSKNRGEILARDFKTSKQVINAWMKSPTHKHAILNPVYNKTGIATSGSWVVQVFFQGQTPTVDEYRTVLQQVSAINF